MPSTNLPPNLFHSLSKSVVGLVAFALFTAGLVSFTHLNTKTAIQANLAAAQAQRLYELAPATDYQLDLNQQLLLPAAPQLGHQQEFYAYLAYQNLQPQLLLLPVSTQAGYTGTIDILLAVHLNGTVQGVRVVQHQETPGLGDKIEARKSNWIQQFHQRSLTNPNLAGWAVKKDGGQFDEFTGATITPRAVVHLVRDSLLWLEEINLEELIHAQFQP